MLKNQILSGWPGQGLAWKQAGVQESSGQVSGRTQPARYFQTRFRSSTDILDNTVQNQSGCDLVLADCVRFKPNGSGPEASRCARIIRPASGQCFPADPDRMRIGFSTFTGLLRHLSGMKVMNARVGAGWGGMGCGVRLYKCNRQEVL